MTLGPSKGWGLLFVTGLAIVTFTAALAFAQGDPRADAGVEAAAEESPVVGTEEIAAAGSEAGGGLDATEVEETLRWLRMPPAWVLVLVIIPLLVGFVAFFYRRELPIGSPRWRWALGAIRLLVLLLVVFMLAQPVRNKTVFERRDSTILVLADDSLSMDLTDRYADRELAARLAELLRTSVESVESTRRYDLVRRLLRDPQENIEGRLRAKGKVAVATFARSVRSLGQLSRQGPSRGESGSEDADAGAAGEVDGEGAEGSDGAEAKSSVAPFDLPSYATVREDPRVQETRIAESLRDGVGAVLGSGFGRREERVSGVLLFSDGQENADSIPALEIARRLGERGTPIFAVGVGNPADPKDLRVTNLEVNEVVLVDDTVPVDVSIVADGFEGESTRVSLEIDSVEVDSKAALIEGGGKRQSVRLEFQPTRPGRYTVTVKVEELAGEVFYENNSASKTVTVLDQKIKVLYAEYLPRWEYRYLKNALIRDKTVEARVYLFSADPGFTQDSSPGVAPLRRFPNTRQELFEYHVIVLGDVNAEEHLGAEVVDLLKEFVLEGGGVVFLSGPHASPGSYVHTELYPLLPVEIAEARGRPSDRGPITEAFNVTLSAVGREHPVMRLDNDAERNLQLWQNEDRQYANHLPGFYWFAESRKAKAGTVVLARHESRASPEDMKGHVIFAFMSYGKGKTFFSAVDNTWRWRAGVDNLYFARFWGQVFRFVATGRLLGDTARFSISTDKETYGIGEEVKVEARVYDVNMRPSTEPTVTAYHLGPTRDDLPPERLELVLNEGKGPGTYEGALRANLRGRHDLWLGTEDQRAAFTSLNVEVPALEARETRLDRGFLRQIAEASGGEYVDLPEVASLFDRIEGSTRSEAGLVENDDLWDEAWVVALITGLIASEWILRKWVRLV